MIMYHFMIMRCSVYIVFISWYWNLTVYSDTLMEIQDINTVTVAAMYLH